uniref:RING-type domain-containing protein n=1 Tax=Noctiluca scintillans TaxID=2966 RepID=A0A7S1A0Z0_NOCSC|mmetsp:Transcript_27232/g.71719  ORF Transcript_27232/g.71719 Transcript_27232/m.71719 type:complete len:158 (+) Transcript_27232:45-518(+)
MVAWRSESTTRVPSLVQALFGWKTAGASRSQEHAASARRHQEWPQGHVPPSGWVAPGNSYTRRQSAPPLYRCSGTLGTTSPPHRDRRQSTPTSFDDQGAGCVICFESPGGVVLQPCGHDQFCQYCAKQVRKCPLCRTPMTSWQDGRTLCVFGTPVWI